MAQDASFVPIILSGGAGTRLWPLSRELFPKQLLCLGTRHTLLQETALRVGGSPVVVCNEEHRFIVAEQLRQVAMEPRAIVIEPVGRNTAPAVAVAALALADTPDAIMLVMPSDHLVRDIVAFQAAVDIGLPLARQGHLVTFGIVPSSAHSGYGYIQRGEPLAVGADSVKCFVEKPDTATAETYLRDGRYLWNSGIFLLSAATYLEELNRFEPGMVSACREALARGHNDLFFYRLDAGTFAGIKGKAIDTAVMERTTRAAVVPVDMGWSDIGSWQALWQENEKNSDGNVIEGDVISIATTDCLIRSNGPLVATVGVEGLVVVATDDAILVADKSRDQDVKMVVERLKATGRPEASQPSRSFRPWGWFQTIDNGDRYLVKHIQVNPGARLSLQRHRHRSEHWVVVAGTALVTRGDQSFVLNQNESTFIPLGIDHRLENPGPDPLRIIEVQSGTYIGEDDIIRLEDQYGRITP